MESRTVLDIRTAHAIASSGCPAAVRHFSAGPRSR